MTKIAKMLIKYYASGFTKSGACKSAVRETVFSSRCASDVTIKRIKAIKKNSFLAG